MASPFSESVFRAVRRVPYGRVATYGDIASLAGHPRSARGVGAALRSLPQGSSVPWWRVVGAGGDIALPELGGELQRMLLIEEGVAFRGGRKVTLDLCRWRRTE